MRSRPEPADTAMCLCILRARVAFCWSWSRVTNRSRLYAFLFFIMLILAADTSGKSGSIALARCDVRCDVLATIPLEGGTFSAQLVPQIATLLAAHNLSKAEIDGF